MGNGILVATAPQRHIQARNWGVRDAK